MAETHVIEVRAGRGEPPSLELRPGLELAPLSVGTGGAWQVNAGGVRLVHLYLYFDGQTLFLQAADEQDPPMIDGRPVPMSWTPASAPCSITFGQARLTFHPTDAHDDSEEEPTYAQPLQQDSPQQAPAPAPRRDVPARPFKPGAFVSSDDGESTRLQPAAIDDYSGSLDDSTRVEPLHAAMGPPATVVRPAAGAPWTRTANAPPKVLPPPPTAPAPRDFPPPPASQPDSTKVSEPGPPGPPSGLLNVPPPSIRKPPPEASLPEKIKHQWEAAPPLRRGLIVALPIGVIMGLWLALGAEPTPPPRPPLVAVAPPPPVTPPPPVYTATPPWPPVQPFNPPPPPPVAGGSTPPAGGAVADAAVVVANSDRRERQAGDLVATHSYEQAIRIYEELANERPQNPAFHEAARILRNKLQTGTP